MLEDAGICQNIPEYARICWKMPEYAEICQNVLKCVREII